MSITNVNPAALENGGLSRPAGRRLYRFPVGLREVPEPRTPVDDDLPLVEEPNIVVDGAPLSPLPSAVQSPVTQPRISVVIPTRNEARNLPHVFALLPDDLHEVVLVDGNSVDDTIAVARALRPDVVVLSQNRIGKGNAMACGFAAATGDVVVMLDADGSADPREIPRFVEALLAGADFAKGTRFAEGGGSNDITRLRAWGNRCLNRTANLFFGARYTDLCYGYNAFWRSRLDDLALDPRPDRSGGKLWGDGFEIETIINARVAKAGLAIAEVPSFEHPRLYGQTNLNTWRDGTRVLVALLVERVNGKGRRRRSRRDVRPVGRRGGDVVRQSGTGPR